MDPKYKIAEDPITDFFYSNWAKVTPKWLASRDIKIIRPEASSSPLRAPASDEVHP